MRLEYRQTDAIGAPCLGLIALSTDETVEPELHQMMPPGAALYVTRIESAPEVTAESLGEMEARLPAAAGLLPQTLPFAAVGYACTSGATVIGPILTGVEKPIQICSTTSTANDILNMAVLAACKAK